MLTGDETGWLLGDYLLSQLDPGEVSEHAVVASTVVSSRMLAAIAAAHGARHVETLTGFKWLSRADADLPGYTLVYAYEEAIGYCVDPSAVRDKDGISAAVLFCDLVAALREQGRTVLDALDALARRHGVHTTTAVTRPVADADAAAEVMTRLRSNAPSEAGRLRRHDDRSGARPAVRAAHRRADLRRRRRPTSRCGWRCGRREPSRRSSPTSRFGGTASTATWTPPARDADGMPGGRWPNRRRSAPSAARTDGRRRRRGPGTM